MTNELLLLMKNKQGSCDVLVSLLYFSVEYAIELPVASGSKSQIKFKRAEGYCLVIVQIIFLIVFMTELLSLSLGPSGFQ